MVMKKVILAFPDLLKLVDYTLVVDVTQCEINRTGFTLICELSEADIELAKMGYEAYVLESIPKTL